MSDSQAGPSSDQILAALARAEDLLEQGFSMDEVYRALSVPPSTYRTWRKAHSRTFLATARRVEALEEVQERLLGLLTEQQQEIRRLNRLLQGRESEPPRASFG